MMNYKQVIEQQKQVIKTVSTLRELGIIISLTNPGVVLQYNWESVEYVCKAVDLLGFFDELSRENEIALALASYQEENQCKITDAQLKMVNDFFDTPYDITRENIAEMGTRFI